MVLRERVEEVHLHLSLVEPRVSYLQVKKK